MFQDLHAGLKQLLEYDGDVQEDFDISFQVRRLSVFPTHTSSVGSSHDSCIGNKHLHILLILI